MTTAFFSATRITSFNRSAGGTGAPLGFGSSGRRFGDDLDPPSYSPFPP